MPTQSSPALSHFKRCAMSRKWFFLGSLIVFLTVMAVLGNLTASPVRAQCGDTPADSSCITCHEYQVADPIFGKGEWHAIHALKDCCWNCHGGNTKTQDKDLAHIGMISNPLQDIYKDCYSCHPDNYQALAEQFALDLGITPSSSPTVTPVPTGATVEHPISMVSSAVLNAPSAFPWPLAIGGLAFAILLTFSLGYLYARQRG